MLANPFNIRHDSGDQFVDIVEDAHRAQPRDELELNLMTVDISIEVEKMSLAIRSRAIGKRRRNAASA